MLVAPHRQPCSLQAPLPHSRPLLPARRVVRARTARTDRDVDPNPPHAASPIDSPIDAIADGVASFEDAVVVDTYEYVPNNVFQALPPPPNVGRKRQVAALIAAAILEFSMTGGSGSFQPCVGSCLPGMEEAGLLKSAAWGSVVCACCHSWRVCTRGRRWGSWIKVRHTGGEKAVLLSNRHQPGGLSVCLLLGCSVMCEAKAGGRWGPAPATGAAAVSGGAPGMKRGRACSFAARCCGAAAASAA